MVCVVCKVREGFNKNTALLIRSPNTVQTMQTVR